MSTEPKKEMRRGGGRVHMQNRLVAQFNLRNDCSDSIKKRK